MNFYSMILRTLAELKRPLPPTFAALTQPDHVEIKNALNQVNKNVLQKEAYTCRELAKTIEIPAELTDYFTEVTISTNINGEIKNSGIIVDKKIYNFVSDISNFYTENVNSNDYGIFNDKLFFKSSPDARTATILYLTYDYAKTAGGTGKTTMTLETDTSIIPTDLIENILVYGACLQVKGSNSADARLTYWNKMHTNGIKLLNDYNQANAQGISFKLLNGRSSLDIRR